MDELIKTKATYIYTYILNWKTVFYTCLWGSENVPVFFGTKRHRGVIVDKFSGNYWCVMVGLFFEQWVGW